MTMSEFSYSVPPTSGVWETVRTFTFPSPVLARFICTDWALLSCCPGGRRLAIDYGGSIRYNTIGSIWGLHFQAGRVSTNTVTSFSPSRVAVREILLEALFYDSTEECGGATVLMKMCTTLADRCDGDTATLVCDQGCGAATSYIGVG